MRKAGLYIFLFTIFLNNLSLNQLAKLPVLVKHLFEHQQLDNKIGLVDFLYMHYWGHDLNDNDQDRDNQLPFKQMDANLSMLAALPITKPVIQKPEIFLPPNSWPIIQNHHLPQRCLEVLFRPPQA